MPLAVALGRVLPAEQVSVVLPELEDVQQVKVGVVRPVPVPAILLSPCNIKKSYKHLLATAAAEQTAAAAAEQQR